MSDPSRARVEAAARAMYNNVVLTRGGVRVPSLPWERMSDPAKELARAMVSAALNAADTLPQAGGETGRVAGLEAEVERLRKAAEEAIACFDAAEAEGLTTVLIESDDERLKDLVIRRLNFAPEALRAALEGKE